MSKRRKRTRNDIAMAYRIESLGYGRKRVSKIVFYRTVLAWLRGETFELPRGWQITWLWRNSRKSALRSDTIENTVAQSRDSFIGLMERRLERDLNSIGFTARGRAGKKRKARAQKKHKRVRKMSRLRKAKARQLRARKRHKGT